MIGLLRRRDFALLWWGGLVSVAGDWMLLAVLPYVVYARTGSTLATAGMTVAELLPGIVLGSFAGVLVDRWDRRRVLVAVDLLQAASVALLLLLLHSAPHGGSLAVVYVVAVLQSSLSAFSLPAESALLPSLVPAEDLVSANALNVLNNRVGRLAGVPLGTAVYAAAGLGAVVLVDAATFVAAAALVAAVRPPRAPVAGETTGDPLTGWRGLLSEWTAGLRLVRTDRSIGVLFVVFGLMTFAGTMLDPLNAPWVRDVLHGGPTVYALLMMVHSAAGITGALAVGWLGGRVPARVLTGLASVVAGLVLLVRFNVPVLAVAVALGLVSGLVAVASSVGVEALAQQRVPEPFRGRVFGLLQAAIWALSLLGAVVAGVGGEVLGVLPMLNVASVLTAVAGVVVLVALPRTAADRARTATR